MSAPDAAPIGRGSLRSRATRGALVTLGGQTTAQLLRMIGNLVLSRLLFPEAFGLMSLISLTMFAVEQVFNVGTQSTVVRHERGDDPKFLDTAWTIQVCRGVLLWAGTSAVAPLIARFYGEPQLASLLPVALLSLVIGSLGSMRLALLARRVELGRRVAIDLVAQVLTLATMAGLAWYFRSVWALVIGGLVNQTTRTVLSHVALAGRRDRFAWDRSAARELLAFGRWVLMSSGLSFLANQLDVAILGRLVPIATLGVYTIGMTVPNLLREMLAGLAASVMMPSLSEANRSSGPAFRRAYAAAQRVTLPIGVVAALAAVVVGPAFFDYLYDSRYANAAWIAQLGALRLWFGYMQVTSCSALFAYGDARTWAISSGVAAALTGVGCIVGFQFAGLPGVLVGLAFASAAGYAVAAIQLARAGIGSVRSELEYTLVAALLALVSLSAAHYAATVLPELAPSLRTLLCGVIVVGPFAIWTATRAYKEMRGVR